MNVRPVLLAAAGLLVFTACKAGETATPTPSASAGAATATTSPPGDPMAMPRLEGTYEVVKKIISTKNFSDINRGDTFKRTYEVTLDCPTGPCDGSVVIDAEESKGTVEQQVVWDESTHTYSFAGAINSATCPGIDGKTYTLKTTNTYVLTPTHVDTLEAGAVVTKFTALGKLKAVAQGAAKSSGRCGTSTATFKYTGQLHQ